MNWYQLDLKQLEQQLHVVSKKGLSLNQVEERRKKYGLNLFEEKNPLSKWFIFLKQFQDFMVLVLLIATLIAGLLGEYIDAIAIIFIVFVNGFIGYFQEQKAEDSLEKLKELSAPMATVLREGEWVNIPSQEIVVGDVIRLRRGDRVTADIRLIQANSLETEESALTGESLPVAKNASVIQKGHVEVQDQTNMAFMGTLVTRGNGIGIVTSTGMNTEMGTIAHLISSTEKGITPLEHKLSELGKILIVVCLLLTAAVFGIGIFQGHPVYDMFLAGVSLAVAAIPEGLPAIVTVVLSLGVQRMIRRKAIARKLSAVETLGSTSVICTDKTGTITENEMTVKEIFLNGEYIHVTGEGYDIVGDFYISQNKINENYPNLQTMLLYGELCNHASLKVKRGRYVVDGDPTDGALLIAARKYGIQPFDKEQFTIVKEFPFDAERKRMSVVVEDENGMQFLITKGAPDILLPRSTHYLDRTGRKLFKSKRKSEMALHKMANQSLRTIAICFRPLAKNEILEPSLLERDLTFIGLFGMMDPPRKGVKEAIKECQKAGIKTVMITGDHAKTAEAIAKQIGLLPKGGLILEGYEINEMTSAELKQIVEDVYVFARVTPEDKLKIVKAYQERDHIVAMTGDGVNDAPAIKASDIGISMGITGTDVTKEASSLILLDDNFSTIRNAIYEGRNIYDNIRKFVRYLLASNVGEILVMLFAILLGMPLPLVPVQILWVNLVTDGLPAMALGVDQPEENLMQKPPRDPNEGIFSQGIGFKIISRGFLIGIVTLIAFLIAYRSQPDGLVYGQTIAFSTLVMAQLIHVFDCRNEQSIFSRNPFENIYLVFAVLSSVVLLLVVIYFEPLQPIFHTTYLGLEDWLLIMGLAALPTILFSYPRNRS